MRLFVGALICVSWLAWSSAAPALGQEDAPPLPPNGVRLDKSLTQRWQVGIKITAPANGACVGVFGTATVPTQWPEQQVELVDKSVSPGVEVKFRTLNNGVRQMLMTIARLEPGEQAEALMTYRVTKHALLPPEDMSIFRQPPIDQYTRTWLTESHLIESTHNQIRNLAKELVEGETDPVRKVERIYDWVRQHVDYQEGPIKGALAALRDGTGDCEELTSLFIAVCRAARIPARTVWVPGHCYPEFYLVDDAGNGHWIPCQAAGTRDFGAMPDFRPILQKGDNFRVPEKPRGKFGQRYVAEHLKVKAVTGGGQPQVSFIRQLLPDEG